MSRSLETVLDESNPNKLAAAGRELLLGKAMAQIARTERVTVTGDVATLSKPARVILACFASAGTAPGFKTPIQTGAPAAGQVSVGATGTAVFNGTDAIAEAEVHYLAAEGLEVVDEEIDVVTNVGTPLQNRKVLVLLAAEALVGGSTGAKTVAVRGTTPGAGNAAAGAVGTVVFAGADAVTRARVSYIAFPDAAAGGSVASRLAADVAI